MASTLLPSAARTTSGQSAEVTVGSDERLSFYLDVSAASGGSPLLDIAIQESPDNGTTWFERAAFTQATTTSQQVLHIQDGPLAGIVRADFVIAGTTPSFTFALYMARSED